MSTGAEPLRITCTSSDCEHDLHCFRPTAKMSEAERGNCRTCGADLVGWERIHRRDLSDAANTFSELEKEMFRNHMLHLPIPQRLAELGLKQGPEVLRQRTARAIRGALSKPHSQNPWDGRQTPRDGTDGARVQHYAQHASATCCRVCLDYWHGIPAEAVLTDEQMEYCIAITWLFIDERLGPFELS
jgi:Domain of unknown function (DUF4186)